MAMSAPSATRTTDMKALATVIITIVVALGLLVLGAYLDGYASTHPTKEQQQ